MPILARFIQANTSAWKLFESKNKKKFFKKLKFGGLKIGAPVSIAGLRQISRGGALRFNCKAQGGKENGEMDHYLTSQVDNKAALRLD